jgi:protein SCO1/2
VSVRKSGAALVAVTMLGLTGLAWATASFSVLTSEAARQQSVARAPVLLSPLHLQDQSGRTLQWPQNFVDDGRVSIVTFIYTRCRSICSVLNAQYRQMQETLLTSGLQSRVRLMTVSFDPARDTATVVRDHAQLLGARPDVWQIARPLSDAELRSTLQQFGVVAVPDGVGEFVHNAAWHIVDTHGRLARIVALEDPDLAIQTALELSPKAHRP